MDGNSHGIKIRSTNLGLYINHFTYRDLAAANESDRERNNLGLNYSLWLIFDKALRNAWSLQRL